MNYNAWSIQEEIKKQVNREAVYVWANSPNPTLPTFKPSKREKNKMFWKVLFLSLRP